MGATGEGLKPSRDHMYAVRNVPGKGKGLDATRDIARGTRLICEEPLLRMKKPKNCGDERICPHPCPTVLHPSKRPVLLALHNPHAHIPSMKYLGIIKANGLMLQPSFPVENQASSGSLREDVTSGPGKHGSEELGVFVLTSRINHSCDNNAHSTWNEDTKRCTVHASQDIKMGEEITINYAGPFSVPDKRRELLQENCGLLCSCRFCSLSPSMARGYNKQMCEAYERTGSVLRESNGARFLFGIPPVRLPGYEDPIRVGVLGGITGMLANIDLNIRTYEAHGMGVALAVSVSLAATICALYGDLSRCSVFWEWAAHEWKILEGEDSPRFIHSKAQARNPQRDHRTTKLKNWATKKGDVPRGLEDGGLGDFEQWLWQRTAKPAGSESGDDSASEQEDRHVAKRRKTVDHSGEMSERTSGVAGGRHEKDGESSSCYREETNGISSPGNSPEFPASGKVPGNPSFEFHENDNEEDEDFYPEKSDSEGDSDF